MVGGFNPSRKMRLLCSDSSHLCCLICSCCRKFDFQASFDHDFPHQMAMTWCPSPIFQTDPNGQLLKKNKFYQFNHQIPKCQPLSLKSSHLLLAIAGSIPTPIPPFVPHPPTWPVSPSMTLLPESPGLVVPSSRGPPWLTSQLANGIT